jgi:hypothetical protein
MLKTEFAGITLVEWIGYIASVIILISFLMKDMKKLRVINIVGCLLFASYGFLLNVSWPIVITNLAIVVINLFFLLRPRTSN